MKKKLNNDVKIIFVDTYIKRTSKHVIDTSITKTFISLCYMLVLRDIHFLFCNQTLVLRVGIDF